MDTHLASIYFFYQRPLVRLLRVILSILLFLLVVGEVIEGIKPTLSLSFLNLFIMMEIFSRYHLSTLQGSKTLQSSPDVDNLHVTTLAALGIYNSGNSSQSLVRHLMTYPQVKFLLERANIAKAELPVHSVQKTALLDLAGKIARQIHGKRITTMDMMAAYLLLSEDESKLLFTKQLKERDLLQIVQWARLAYPYEEEVRKFIPHTPGGGIGQFLVTGWTLETKKYTRNFTNELLINDISITGREQEYNLLKSSLLKSENNNVLLIGEVGVGKEHLVKKLALDSYQGIIEDRLGHKTILELMVGSLLAGVTAQGDLQQRVQSIIEEISHAENVILYIPDFQNLIGAGTFSLDLSGALVPSLKTGKLPVIASMTEGNYKAYLERNSLNELFSPIHITEPKVEQAEYIVMEKANELEQKKQYIITYKALETAVMYADRYTQTMQLPGSAVALLSDAMSTLSQDVPRYEKNKRILIDQQVLKTIESKTKIALREPSQDEKTLLLHLEEHMHEQVIGQDDALKAIATAMRRLRSGIEVANRPVSFLFLGPTGVGKSETAKTLARLYFGGEEDMIRLDMSEYGNEDGLRRLLGSLPGEGTERGELTEKVRDHPYSLILLDEFEKAHPTILNLFLQVLEDGRLTDNRGMTVSFVNTIIIATSNAASQFIHESVESGQVIDAAFQRRLLEYLQENAILKPELLNRFDDVVTFKPLSESELMQVASLLLKDVVKMLSEKDIASEIDEKVLPIIVKNGFDKDFGARPLRRYIQDTLEDLISSQLLEGTLHRGDRVNITLDQNEKIILEKVHVYS